MIEIYAVSYNGQPAAADLRVVFGGEGGTLGRGPDNRLTLPDPARHVSRVQARLRFDGARYWIANVSEANPLFLNDEEIESNRERPIAPGDELRVGLYVLRAREASGPIVDYRPSVAPASADPSIATGAVAPVAAPVQPQPASQPFVPRPPAPPIAPAAPASLDGLLGGSSPIDNPFADLMGNAAPIAPAPAAAVAPPIAPPPMIPAAAQPLGPAPPPPPTAAPNAGADPFAGLISPAPVQPAPPTAANVRDPFADILPPRAAGDTPSAGAAPSVDPFADLLARPAAPSASAPSRPQPAFPSGGIPEDFDPFAPAPSRRHETGDPLRDLAGKGIDLGALGAEPPKSLVDFDPARKADPRDALAGGTPSLVDPLQAVDPLQLFGGRADRLVAPSVDTASSAQPMKDSLPEIGASFTPPRAMPDPSLPAASAAAPARAMPPAAPQPPRAAAPAVAAAVAPAAPSMMPGAPPPMPPAATRPASAPSPYAPPRTVREASRPGSTVREPARPASTVRMSAPPVAAGHAPAASAAHAPLEACVAAFLEGAHAAGAGIGRESITPELMRALGAIVYQAVAGAMELIAARQITKREIGAEVTMIMSSGNNPLKFLPTPEAAMMQMLGPRMPGFMQPDRAMQDAFHDLRAHELGVIAGTRAAFAEVLRRFNPATLEERLGKGGLVGSLVPAARRAKLWELFEARFNEIHREAQDDFDSLFGQAFTKAYQEEVARHRGGQSTG